jgi:hypothetical protein
LSSLLRLRPGRADVSRTNDLAVPIRTWLHARAFTALTARGLPGEAVEHALRADLTGDDGAIRAMTHAGMTALRSGAPARATRHLRAAVRAAGDRAGADALLALAESLLVAGYPGEEIPVCYRLRAQQQLTRAQRVTTLRILGRAFSATGAYGGTERPRYGAIWLFFRGIRGDWWKARRAPRQPRCKR